MYACRFSCLDCFYGIVICQWHLLSFVLFGICIINRMFEFDRSISYFLYPHLCRALSLGFFVLVSNLGFICQLS